MRPEGLLPRHVDVPARGEVVEPALAFIDVLGIENQRKARVLRVAAGRHPVAPHDIAARNADVGVGDSRIRKLHTGRTAFFAVIAFWHFAEGNFIEKFCADGLLVKGGRLSAVAGERDVGT